MLIQYLKNYFLFRNLLPPSSLHPAGNPPKTKKPNTKPNSFTSYLAKDFFAFTNPDTTGIITAITKNNVPTDFMVRQFWNEP